MVAKLGGGRRRTCRCLTIDKRGRQSLNAPNAETFLLVTDSGIPSRPRDLRELRLRQLLIALVAVTFYCAPNRCNVGVQIERLLKIIPRAQLYRTLLV